MEFASNYHMQCYATEEREVQIRMAASACQMSIWPPPPKGITKPRWRAMLTSIHLRGLPT